MKDSEFVSFMLDSKVMGKGVMFDIIPDIFQLFWFVADRKWCVGQYDMVQMGVPGRSMI